MKCTIDILSELGDRLRDFGSSGEQRDLILRACRENGWFSPAEVCAAVEAIVSQMLSRDKLTQWLLTYNLPVREARRVLVVMAGNIPLVGFFDLLCVVASGHQCIVKSSSKDSVLMRYMVEQLRDIEPLLCVEFCDDLLDADAVIATGSDNTNRYFRARYGSTPSLLRGNRHSVAVLSGNESGGQLAMLSQDIWCYSGLGCRSVSLVFAPEGFCFELLPPAINPKYRNNYLQHRALLTMNNREFCDLGVAIVVESSAADRVEFSTNLSEIRVVRYSSLAQVDKWLLEHDRELQCVVSESINHPCRVDYGSAQHPALTDYPDREDVMEFLSQLK